MPLQQSLAADVADDAVLAGQALEAGAEPFALTPGIAAQVALEDLAQHGDARRRTTIGLPSKVWPSTKPGFSAIGPQKASAIGCRQIIADSGA